MCWLAVAFVLLFHVNGGWCCPRHERDSLLRFKASVLDPSHQLLKSWHGFNCCEWNGIQCHPHTHHVIRLDLHTSRHAYEDGDHPNVKRPLSNLTGDVLSPLFNLEQLEHLDVSWNNFSAVPIPPGLARLKSLRYSDLSYAGFSGDIPRELGNMSTLHYLDLSYNDLRMVDVRAWTGNMRDLRELILDNVNMSRVESNELDNALSTMYSLTSLRMIWCRLSGEFPPSLANLTNLTHLQLNENGFNGSIPSALLSLPKLQLLDLSWNKDLGGNLSSILPQHPFTPSTFQAQQWEEPFQTLLPTFPR
ncbi:hypothetical protein SUGI_0345820 [Cryptomeria japonica]|nr:hypothetical protein SUGI_0345820 [Cryptomeria japonica]